MFGLKISLITETHWKHFGSLASKEYLSLGTQPILPRYHECNVRLVSGQYTTQTIVILTSKHYYT